MSLSNLFRKVCLSGLIATLGGVSHADSGRVDYDLDDDGLIEINDLADLDEIRRNIYGTTLYGSDLGCPASGCNGFELTTDLDFDTSGDGLLDYQDAYWNAGIGWAPISSFYGVFRGNGHVINNLFISRTSGQTGLFGALRNAVVTDLILSGPLLELSGTSSVGVLAGAAILTDISNVHVTSGKVSGSSDIVGGLIGKYDGGRLEHSSSVANVTGNSYVVGGLVGAARGFSGTNLVISHSFTSGYVSAGRDKVGGLVGYFSDGLIEDSFSLGEVSGGLGNYGFGGLVGQGNNAIFVRSYATGKVSGNHHSAGLVGYAVNSHFTACFATGEVISDGLVAGGLVGYLKHGGVYLSYSTSSVTVDSSGVTYAGGLIGTANPESYPMEITGSYAVGALSASYRGGLMGYDMSSPTRGVTLTSNYWAFDRAGLVSDVAGRGLPGARYYHTQADLQQAAPAGGNSIFNGWDSYSYTDSSGDSVQYWDFGTTAQLPGLNLSGVVYRDGDADGGLD